MRFIASASAVLGMVSVAIAQTADFNPIYTPTNLEDVPAGSSFEVTWTAPPKYADGTVSIHLIGGADQNTLVPIADIASGIANSDESYTWSVDAALGAEALYGLVFKLESNPEVYQYSLPFHIKASTGGEDGGDNTVIITTVIGGTKTVTLSSCPPTDTFITATVTASEVIPTPSVITPTSVPAINTTSVYVPTTSIWSTTSAWNTTVVPTLPPVVPTTTAIEVPPTTAVPPPAVPTGGAVRVGSSLAVVGGLVMALLI